MKGYRLYEELENKGRKSERSKGTVFATDIADGPFVSGDDVKYEGAGAVYDRPDSPLCWCGASLDYLRSDCRRISEAKARKIHSALFAYLEQGV